MLIVMPFTFINFSYVSTVYIHGKPAASAPGRPISYGPTSSSTDGNAGSTTTSSGTSGSWDLSSCDPSSSSWITLCLCVYHSTGKCTSSIHTGRPNCSKVGNFSFLTHANNSSNDTQDAQDSKE